MIDTQSIFEIHHLKQQGFSERKIAKTVHLTRKTVRKYLDNPIQKRPVIRRKSKLDPFKNEIKQLLEQDSRVSAQVVKQRIESMGYAGGITIIRDYLQKVRPTNKQAFIRFESAPGKQMQVDWGHFGSLAYGHTRRKLYALAVVEAYSRMLAMTRDKQPDLILLDIMMPKMDGLEVCRRLKGDPSLPFMPIILVTAKADSKDVVAGLEAGGDEYLTKPVDHAALVARVKSMLRIKSLHDRALEQSAQLKLQLKTATKIQSLFWPDFPKLEEGSHIWALSVPAAYVGGDLYDIIPLPDESLLVYVADVSDKGVPAALIMAALSVKIRSEARNQTDVDKLLETVNNSLHRLISEEGFFATIVLLRYWPKSGKMQFSIGGHFQPLWIVESGIGDFPQAKGISLGITPNIHYEKKETLLSPGESILLYTDGVTEAENERKELYGYDRMIGYIKNSKGPPWGEGLTDEIGKWRGNAKANDDLTLLEIWRE